ncbi:DnaT-like ssDNA-binding domain-containing protein [Glaciecola sp. 1036]|uniref:DnaT-like ssDNA-binding domain-containing protein n=1 Tax=Alteromonadaceae TaxID=72275 RepID=UPI003D091D4D
MNSLEIEALQQPLSNEARTLYCVYLRPQWSINSQKITVKNKTILQLLNSKKETITLGRQISALFKELVDIGLVKFIENIEFSKSLNNQYIYLPLAKVPKDDKHQNLHQQHGSMSISWRPDTESFTMLSDLVGLIDKEYSADELGEFIAYWLGRPEVTQTPYQWTQKFVLQLKHRRIKRPVHQEQTKAGHQWITPQAGIAFDENVEKLVNKYSDKL